MPFEIKRAERKGKPQLIGLWGPSNSGKTMSALRIARGLAGDKGKIVLIDTENGRAENYAEKVGGWDHLDFQPPFRPLRYTEAVGDAERFGANVVIVDSTSHCWQGEGGVVEMAEASKTQNNRPMTGLGKWKSPKMEFTKMMNALLRCRVHIIFCLRVKELNVQRGKGKDAEIESMGLVPICEKNFIYEMTIAFLIGPDHKTVAEPTDDLKFPPIMPAFKIPEELIGAIKPRTMLTEATGEAIADWVAGGKPLDEGAEALKRKAYDIATKGAVALRDWWRDLSVDDRATIKPIGEDLRATADEADRAAAEASRDENADAPPVDPLDDMYTDAAERPADDRDNDEGRVDVST